VQHYIYLCVQPACVCVCVCVCVCMHFLYSCVLFPLWF
jgi:hypothetical protein